MGTFYTGNTPLPPPKVDANPPQGLPGELDAADINNLWNAVGDLRAQLQLALGAQLSAQISTQQITSKLIKGAEDAFITVVSDSTAYTSGYLTTPNPIRWVSRLGTALGAKFPAYTVKLNEWDDTSQAYLGWATLATGTGSQTLWISNASWSGMNSGYVLGSRLAKMVTVTTPDLVMWSHGHNEQFAIRSYSWGTDAINALEEIAAAVPNASILVIGQNPRAAPASEPSSQTLRVTRYAEIAARRGYGFLNIYQAFIDYGPTWATDLLNSDGIHPNDAGSQLWADETARAFVPSRFNLVSSRQPPSLLTAESAQLLVNGNFASWDVSAPNHWVVISAPTITKDTTNFESGQGYSVHLVATGGGYLSENLPLKSVAGKWVTLAARVYVATGQPTWFGSLYLRDNLGSTQSTDVNTFDSWRWKMVQRYFDPAVTAAEVRLYADFQTGTGAVSIDRVSAVVGLVPYDVPPNRDATRVYRTTSDFTTAANTSLQAIPGLVWDIPLIIDAAAFAFEVHLLYSQATAPAAVSIGVQSSATMNNLNAQGHIQTDATVTTAGVLTGLTTATGTAVVTGTPAAIGTVYAADIYGMEEAIGRAVKTTMQIVVSTATAANAVTIKRGSYAVVKFY